VSSGVAGRTLGLGEREGGSICDFSERRPRSRNACGNRATGDSKREEWVGESAKTGVVFRKVVSRAERGGDGRRVDGLELLLDVDLVITTGARESDRFARDDERLRAASKEGDFEVVSVGTGAGCCCSRRG